MRHTWGNRGPARWGKPVFHLSNADVLKPGSGATA